MDKHYKHLTAEERGVIQAERQRGATGAAIAHLLGRSPSTISRELRRNAPAVGDYAATLGGQSDRQRRRACVRRRTLRDGTPLYDFVRRKLLYRYWSPQQIAVTLRGMHPDDPSWQVSHETIYAAIYAYPKGALKKEMIAALRQAKPARGRGRRSGARKGGLPIPEALRIHNRPEDVAERKLPGHWEGDLIKGAFNRSAVGTIVERKTRFVLLCKMKDATADAALESFTRQMKKVPALLRESFTYDRGSEMARHEELAKRLSLTIGFADPYSPWQRGSNDNTNGLLRQFLPKGMDLSTVSQTKLNDIARLLNTRPRQTLNWKTPEQAMAAELDTFQQRVALDS